MATEQALSAVQARFPDIAFDPRPMCRYLDGRTSGQTFIRVPKHRLIEVMKFLRDDGATLFEQLTDVTCVDYLNFPSENEIDPDGRFGVTYSLVSHSHNHRLWVKVFVDDPNPEIPSVWPLWHGAEWTEREVYDMFGIRFTDHPDLRRILLPPNFVDHPLRKDYPLTGKGERENFPVVSRDTA